MSTSSPSSSPPPPSLPHSPPSTYETQSTKKSQAFPWTHKETVHLIRAYQEKWYSLKHGQLKASQWEEVADAVASRCGYGYSHPAKSAIQCRHKMEKLRRRYRDEKRLFSVGGGGGSSWPYFDLMDSLGCEPLAIPALPLVPMPSVNMNINKNNVSGGGGGGRNYGGEEVEEEGGEEEEDYGYRNRSKSRSINYILRKPSVVNRFAGSEQEAVKKRKKREELAAAAEQEEEEDEGKERGKQRMELRLAAEIRGFAERMEGMERKKMEMVRQTERLRMEMEKKRTEMILDSQRKIVDMIAAAAGAFGGSQAQELNLEMVVEEHV